VSKQLDVQQLDRLESVAREAIRTAISAVVEPGTAPRAQEALREFHAAADPQLVLDLITAYHAGCEPIT
jgi:hypothetical protein